MREALSSPGRRFPRLRPIAVALLLAVVAAPLAGREVPYLSGRVVDEAELLSRGAEERIAEKLRVLEQSTGAQVAVLTVESLEDDPLEDFSIRVVETWKLGGADRDDGALLLVARREKRLRLEVGYGLEPTLTDALSGRILDGVIRPRFRQGDFAGGIEAGVEAVAGVLGGDASAVPAEPARRSGGTRVSGCGTLVLVGLFLLMSLFGNLFRPRRRGWRRGSMLLWLPGMGGGRGGGGFGGGGFSGGGGGFGGGGASSGW